MGWRMDATFAEKQAFAKYEEAGHPKADWSIYVKAYPFTLDEEEAVRHVEEFFAAP